jgi:hypothetical protein
MVGIVHSSVDVRTQAMGDKWPRTWHTTGNTKEPAMTVLAEPILTLAVAEASC